MEIFIYTWNSSLSLRAEEAGASVIGSVDLLSTNASLLLSLIRCGSAERKPNLANNKIPNASSFAGSAHSLTLAQRTPKIEVFLLERGRNAYRNRFIFTAKKDLLSRSTSLRRPGQ